MTRDRIQYYQTELKRLHEELLDELAKPVTNPNHVFSLTLSLEEVQNAAYDVGIELMSDAERTSLAKKWNYT